MTSNRPATPLLQGFPPIINDMANSLILGTMPGEESLRMNKYYANSRNAFWLIMSNLLVIPENLTYEERTASLRQHQIALWDVIRTCERQGSLDAKIRQETIQENDFISLFRENPNISRVFFNGARAEKEYLKRVLPKVTGPARNLKLARLPSTSPAMARLSFDEKAYAWSEIIRQGD